MSDLMLLGILQMPFDMVMSSPTSIFQYVQSGHEAARRIKSDAALIEQQAARIAALEAQIAAVAPAVDAQPVAWIDEYALRSLESNATAVCAPIGMRDENQTIPLYASVQSEGLRKDAVWREALEEAAKVCDEIAVDRWNLYKGRKPYTGAEDGRANPSVQGESDGADSCAAAIRALSQKEPR